jgi:hypothetical protein
MPEVRLIDAGNVIAWLNVQIEKARRGDLPIDAIAYYGDAVTFVKNLPTIDAEPVRHGRWIDGTSRGSYSIYCSYCGSHKETICPSEYCPNCGARMDATDTNVGGKGGNG